MAHLAMLTVAIVYALNYYIMKGVLKAVPPFALLGVRIGSGLLFFAIITWGKWRFERKDWLRLIACGLFGVCMNQLFFIWGMSKTNPVNAGVIMTLTPVLVLLIAAIMRVERLTFLRSLGMLVAFCGALLLSLFGKKLAFGNDSVVGDMMIFINATSYAFYLVLVKPLVKKYPPMQLFAALFLVGSLLVLPIAGPAVLETNWTALPFDILLGVGYIILFTTIIAYTFNGWALKRVPSSQVGVYIYLQPMLVSMLSPWLLSDKLEPMQWLYIGLVLLGVMFVNWKKK
ncbi:MAG: DMT family transporter [Bacteroidia bacterium]